MRIGTFTLAGSAGRVLGRAALSGAEASVVAVDVVTVLPVSIPPEPGGVTANPTATIARATTTRTARAPKDDEM